MCRFGTSVTIKMSLSGPPLGAGVSANPGWYTHISGWLMPFPKQMINHQVMPNWVQELMRMSSRKTGKEFWIMTEMWMPSRSSGRKFLTMHLDKRSWERLPKWLRAKKADQVRIFFIHKGSISFMCCNISLTLGSTPNSWIFCPPCFGSEFSLATINVYRRLLMFTTISLI